MVPQFLLTKMGVGPADLDGELPLLGVAVRWLPGPNRPDYCLARMLSPITDHVPESFDMAPVQPHLRASDEDGEFRPPRRSDMTRDTELAEDMRRRKIQ